MNALMFNPSDIKKTKEEYNKAEEALRDFYNKHGSKPWEYSDEEKRLYNSLLKDFNEIKSKAKKLDII